TVKVTEPTSSQNVSATTAIVTPQPLQQQQPTVNKQSQQEIVDALTCPVQPAFLEAKLTQWLDCAPESYRLSHKLNRAEFDEYINRVVRILEQKSSHPI